MLALCSPCARQKEARLVPQAGKYPKVNPKGLARGFAGSHLHCSTGLHGESHDRPGTDQQQNCGFGQCSAEGEFLKAL